MLQAKSCYAMIKLMSSSFVNKLLPASMKWVGNMNDTQRQDVSITTHRTFFDWMKGKEKGSCGTKCRKKPEISEKGGGEEEVEELKCRPPFIKVKGKNLGDEDAENPCGGCKKPKSKTACKVNQCPRPKKKVPCQSKHLSLPCEKPCAAVPMCKPVCEEEEELECCDDMAERPRIKCCQKKQRGDRNQIKVECEQKLLKSKCPTE